MPDTKNAQIRKKSTSRRQDKDVQAEEARRLLDDPAFVRGYTAVRDGLLYALENLQSDGSKESDDYERELCRSLRTLQAIRRSIALGIQGQKLRLANFQSKNED